MAYFADTPRKQRLPVVPPASRARRTALSVRSYGRPNITVKDITRITDRFETIYSAEGDLAVSPSGQLQNPQREVGVFSGHSPGHFEEPIMKITSTWGRTWCSLSADMRAHVYAVVQTLRTYLDDVDMYGQADFKDAIRDLWVSLNAAAGQADEKHRSKWQALVRDIGIPAAGTVMGSIPTLALEAVSLVAGG